MILNLVNSRAATKVVDIIREIHVTVKNSWSAILVWGKRPGIGRRHRHFDLREGRKQDRKQTIVYQALLLEPYGTCYSHISTDSVLTDDHTDDSKQ